MDSRWVNAMDKLFDFFDAIGKDYQQKLLSSNHNKMKEFQLLVLDKYTKAKKTNPYEKTWSRLEKLDLETKDFKLASQPESVKKNKINSGNDRVYSGAIHINENTIEYSLEEKLQKQGVILCDLMTAVEQHREILDSFTEKTSKDDEKISLVTAGISRHGFLLYIPENVPVAEPLQIINHIITPNTLLPLSGYILLGSQAEAILIMRDTTGPMDDKNAMLTMNLSVSLGEASTLRFVEIQQTNNKVWNFIDEHVVLKKQANYERFTKDSGGKVNKRKFSVILEGEGSQAFITSVYSPKGDQVFIFDTQQNHLASNTTSDLLYSGVLDDQAFSFWKGNVYVAEGTKGADGFQVNKNLLLKESTHAESIPGLEIIADEVKCSHAVTVSSIDPEQVFYLKSRGIETDEAEKLIVDGFIKAATIRIKDKKLLKIIEEELN